MFLQARRRGLPCVALDALCFHNSRAVELPDDFPQSASTFAAKWAIELADCYLLCPDRPPGRHPGMVSDYSPNHDRGQTGDGQPFS
jgi:hypothetical protein